MDMAYISRHNIIDEIHLNFTTVRVLFMKESTEGFESFEGNITQKKLKTEGN